MTTSHARHRRGLQLAAAIATGTMLLFGAMPAAAEEAEGSATVSGVVTSDSDGAPVEGVFVVAQTEDASSIHAAYTNADGSYLIEGITAGDYRVNFESSGTNLIREYWQDTTDWSQATVLSIADGAAITGIDAGLAAGAVITGTVTRADDGSPVEGINVSASGEGYGGGLTDADGVYRIEGLLSGSYAVEFGAGAGGLVGEFWDDARNWASADQVEVGAGQTVSGIDAALDAGGEISGMVTTDAGAPADTSTVRFFASADDIEPVATTWVSGDGTYAAVGLPVGDYIVQFVGGSGLQSEYWDDVRTAAEATPVTVLAGQSTSSIDAELAASAQITGTVTRESDGAPAIGAVFASDADGFASAGSIESDGSYALDIQPGTYVLHFLSSDEAVLSEFWEDAAVEADATPITVTSGEQLTGIDAQLASAAMISGVLHLDSDEYHEQFIEAYSQSGAIAGMAYASTEDGSYTLALPAGTYTLKASAIFYDGRTTVKPQYSGGVSNPKKAAALTVGSGETLTGVDFTLVAKRKGKG